MSRARPQIVVPALLLILLVSVGWSYTIYADARGGASSAAADEAESARLVGRIEQLRQRPAVAGTRELRVTELTARVEEAAAKAGCPEGSIVRIDPEGARRVEDSAYVEKPTQVLVRGVTMQQALTFLHSLAAGDGGLRLKSTRLATVPGEEGDRWQVECTWAYVVYAPKGTGGE